MQTGSNDSSLGCWSSPARYLRITRLMNVNAADAGRDIEAYRRVGDGLISERHERVIVQAKHWPARGVSASEISDLVYGEVAAVGGRTYPWPHLRHDRIVHSGRSALGG